MCMHACVLIVPTLSVSHISYFSYVFLLKDKYSGWKELKPSTSTSKENICEKKKVTNFFPSKIE